MDFIGTVDEGGWGSRSIRGWRMRIKKRNRRKSPNQREILSIRSAVEEDQAGEDDKDWEGV